MVKSVTILINSWYISILQISLNWYTVLNLDLWFLFSYIQKKKKKKKKKYIYIYIYIYTFILI